MDFCYSFALTKTLTVPAVAALMLTAADKFQHPRLLAACRVRVAALLRPGDNELFGVYETAAAVRDTETIAMARSTTQVQRCPGSAASFAPLRCNNPNSFVLLPGGGASSAACSKRSLYAAFSHRDVDIHSLSLERRAQIERYLLCKQCAKWLRELVADRDAWAGFCQPESAANALLQSLLLKVLSVRD